MNYEILVGFLRMMGPRLCMNPGALDPYYELRFQYDYFWSTQGVPPSAPKPPRPLERYAELWHHPTNMPRGAGSARWDYRVDDPWAKRLPGKAA